MATKNNITGDSIISKKTTDLYRDNYDRIFSKKEEEEEPWYITEYNAGVWAKDMFYKAVSMEDTEAQNWIIKTTGIDALTLMDNRGE